jgi:hypothetical protein
MAWVSRFTDKRLDSLYDSEGFGGDKTMRAKVIRELLTRAAWGALQETADEVASWELEASGDRSP